MCASPIRIIIGFATNGEWNSLRTKGNTRPISVLQIRSNVRAKYSRMNLKKLIGMLTPKGITIMITGHIRTWHFAATMVTVGHMHEAVCP